MNSNDGGAKTETISPMDALLFTATGIAAPDGSHILVRVEFASDDHATRMASLTALKQFAERALSRIVSDEKAPTVSRLVRPIGPMHGFGRKPNN